MRYTIKQRLEMTLSIHHTAYVDIHSKMCKMIGQKIKKGPCTFFFFRLLNLLDEGSTVFLL